MHCFISIFFVVFPLQLALAGAIPRASHLVQVAPGTPPNVHWFVRSSQSSITTAPSLAECLHYVRVYHGEEALRQNELDVFTELYQVSISECM